MPFGGRCSWSIGKHSFEGLHDQSAEAEWVAGGVRQDDRVPQGVFAQILLSISQHLSHHIWETVLDLRGLALYLGPGGC